MCLDRGLQTSLCTPLLLGSSSPATLTSSRSHCLPAYVQEHSNDAHFAVLISSVLLLSVKLPSTGVAPVGSLLKIAPSGGASISHAELKHASVQDHYPAVDRDSVKTVMNNMVQAGRLQQVPHHPALVRLGGVARQIEAEHVAMQALSVGDADALSQEDQGKLISDKV